MVEERVRCIRYVLHSFWRVGGGGGSSQESHSFGSYVVLKNSHLPCIKIKLFHGLERPPANLSSSVDLVHNQASMDNCFAVIVMETI